MRRMVAVAVLALAAAGCSSADKGGGGDVAPVPPPAVAAQVDERPADCGPARDVILGPCTMRATADPNAWTIHDANARQIGASSS